MQINLDFLSKMAQNGPKTKQPADFSTSCFRVVKDYNLQPLTYNLYLPIYVSFDLLYQCF